MGRKSAEEKAAIQDMKTADKAGDDTAWLRASDRYIEAQHERRGK